MSDDNVFKIRLVDAPEPDADEEPTPPTVLRESDERGLTSVLVLGYTPEGTMWVSGSGGMTRLDALWLVENAKTQIMHGDDDE